MNSVWSVPTLLRLAENKALSRITLSGSVLDLGGDTRSDYQSTFRGIYRLTTVNFDPKTSPDIIHDLEQPLPIPDENYDHVLLVNVLEHIYRYRELLLESRRVLKPTGQLIIIIPFLFPEHSSPSDYQRLTGMALHKLLEDSSFENITITPLGGGVFSAGFLFIDRLLPYFVRFINYYSARYVASLFDAILIRLSRLLKKKYDPAQYALGYCVMAKKESLL